MSQNPDDSRNNPRNPPPRRDNRDLPGFGPNFAVPSLIFDEYGEVKANIPARPDKPAPNRMPNDEPPSVPSLIFDEYGELKSSALQAFKPASPPPPTRVQGPTRSVYNPPVPVQPPLNWPQLNRSAPVPQVQPPYAAPAPVISREAPAVEGQPGQPGKASKKNGFGLGLFLWILLAALVIILAGGAAWLLVLNKPAVTTNTTPVNLGSLFPFRVLTPGTTSSGVTPQANGADLDTLYNQATAQLKNNQFKEAAATLEQLRERQSQSGNIKHPDVPALLFKAYVSLGDQLNQSPQFADFQQSLVNYQKALDTARTLDAKDRNQQEEKALQTRLDTGNLYARAVTAYNDKELEAAIPLFSQLYAKDQNFRDAPSLYYDSLVRTGDGQFAENLLTDAYKSYARAAQLKNVADTRYAQARAASIESQLRQAGKPVPTAPKP